MGDAGGEESRELLTDRTGPGGAPSRAHIDALDGLRGVAIGMVFLYHYFADIGAKTAGLREIMGIFHSGWCGVDLFFVLSGFLITGILYDAKPSQRYFLNFYARRTLRIFPLYYGVLLAVFVILPFFRPMDTTALRDVTRHQGWLWGYGANLIMGWRASFFFNAGWLLLGHLWSLAIEEQFYLLWPAIIRFCSRRQAMGVCVAIAGGLLVVRTILVLAGGHAIAVYIEPYCRMDSLAVGGLLALAARGSGGMQVLRRPAKWVGLMSLAALVVMFFPTRELDNVAPWVETIGFTLLAFFFAAGMVRIMTAAPQSATARFWTFAPLRSLGKYSYAMYILHLLLLPVYERLFPVAKLHALLHSKTLSEVAFACLAGAATYAAAFLSWHGYEKHFLKLKRHFVYHEPRRGLG